MHRTAQHSSTAGHAHASTTNLSSSTGTKESPSPTLPSSGEDPATPTLHRCSFRGCQAGPFRRPCDLTKHTMSHIKKWKCCYPSCKSTFGTPKDKNRHINTVHKQRKPYSCAHCSKPFGRRDNLWDHVTRVHHPVPMQISYVLDRELDVPAKGSTRDN